MRCLYLAPSGELALVDDPRLDETTERHKLELKVQPQEWQGHPIEVLRRDSTLKGLVMEMYRGWIGRDRLGLARRALAEGRRVWAYWPGEQAVEVIDSDDMASRWRHWLVITSGFRAARLAATLTRVGRRITGYGRAGRQVIRTVRPIKLPAWVVRRVSRGLSTHPAEDLPAAPDMSAEELRLQSSSARINELDSLIASAAPVPFPHLSYRPQPDRRIAGCGVYLRTDFWAKIDSGGSYGHTCYVAKELAAVTERFVCFMAYRYPLLDEYGLVQVALEPRSATATEEDIVTATAHYYRLLKPAFEAIRPAYIYERLCLGNYVGALLSKSLGIPYIVEYNGSEISMRRSFDGTGYLYEYEYLKAESFAFRQATMISVISAEVRNSLVSRGVDADKILINPNGADLTAYAPASPAEKKSIRQELGFTDGEPVIGFTGTFGGWHGIDVLAAAIPMICAETPRPKFLLIGDGNLKHLVDEQVSRHQLNDRVRSVGRVPQKEGARLLKACDIYVSPHNSHMVDSKFFGSPTKIFEYMAMGAGIVASDLEQIGQTLSPALSVQDLLDPDLTVSDERAVLCTPGDLDEFVQAVIALSEQPHLWTALGRNARAAAEQHYSWRKHVGHLWAFMAGERAPETFAADLRRKRPRRVHADQLVAVGAAPLPSQSTPEPLVHAPRVATGDVYKDEVQRQWDNDPAGSHYVKHAEKHTLNWFLEAEAYRYDEYAPWMRETMEFERHGGHTLLEIGGGMGTDLAQFAKNGALVTDVDLSSGHLQLAKENFELRGLQGRFVLQDAETLPFDDNAFDVVYSNGVLHHTPNTQRVTREILRVLKPGGLAIVMMYAENSYHYWRRLVWAIGLAQEQLLTYSMGEIMSRSVERSENAGARPLVKVYTKKRLRNLFEGFTDISVVQRQMIAVELPESLRWLPLSLTGQTMGWNLIIKARKPAR